MRQVRYLLCYTWYYIYKCIPVCTNTVPVPTFDRHLSRFFFDLPEPTSQLYGRLTTSSGGQAILEDDQSCLPVVLAHNGGRWRPGLVEVTSVSIGLEKTGPFLLLHSWHHLSRQGTRKPLEREPDAASCHRYRVLAKTLVLDSAGSFFVRLLRPEEDRELWESGCGQCSDVLTVRLTVLANYPWIRPLASSLVFSAAAGELFEADKPGSGLLQKNCRVATRPQVVVRLRRGVDCRVVEVEEEEEVDDWERWEQLDDETVARMPENEDVNIRFLTLLTWELFLLLYYYSAMFKGFYKLIPVGTYLINKRKSILLPVLVGFHEKCRVKIRFRIRIRTVLIMVEYTNPDSNGARL